MNKIFSPKMPALLKFPCDNFVTTMPELGKTIYGRAATFPYFGV